MPLDTFAHEHGEPENVFAEKGRDYEKISYSLGSHLNPPYLNGAHGECEQALAAKGREYSFGWSADGSLVFKRKVPQQGGIQAAVVSPAPRP